MVKSPLSAGEPDPIARESLSRMSLLCTHGPGWPDLGGWRRAERSGASHRRDSRRFAASAALPAADTLRLSLTALRADLDTLAAGVRQTVALWEEHERATVAVLDEVDASLPGSGTPTGESR